MSNFAVTAAAATLAVCIVVLMVYMYETWRPAKPLGSKVQSAELKGCWHVPDEELEQFGLQAFVLLNNSEGDQYLYIESDKGVVYDGEVRLCIKGGKVEVAQGPDFLDRASIEAVNGGFHLLDEQEQLLAVLEQL